MLLANVTFNCYDGFYGERSKGMSSADRQNPFIKANMIRANCEISYLDRGDFDLVFSSAMLSYQLGGQIGRNLSQPAYVLTVA